MKKTILFTSFFILLLTTILLFAIPASAELYGGDCGQTKDDKVSWTFNTETGVLTIEGKNGTGNMVNFSASNPAPWIDFKADITSVVVKGEVTLVGNRAFADCKNLQTATIGGNVMNLGWGAFANCTTLETVTFNCPLGSIGTAAFYKCAALKAISLPYSVKSIGESAFYECTALESFNIPSNLTQISPNLFYGCTSLKTLGGTPKKLTRIEHCAFSGCTALSGNIVIPEGVYRIADGAFRDCENITSISLPSTIETIGLDAFSGCTGLTEATFNGSEAKWDANKVIAQGGNPELFKVLSAVVKDELGVIQSVKPLAHKEDISFYADEIGRIPAEEKEGMVTIIAISIVVALFVIYIVIDRIKMARKAKKRLHNPIT